MSHLPERLGPYRPLRRLGAGGMGTVYFAYHPDTGEPTAVKTMNDEVAADRTLRSRFAREVAVLRTVRGRYLVPLTGADPDGDPPWLAMPYVAGNTLSQHVRDHGPLTGANLYTFAAAVAHALAVVHAAGVAHRDLKPPNVILAADGPRVVDFGVAHQAGVTALTATSVRAPGTPGWMAPEQYTQGITTQACDVFTWGLLVAYAATGGHPFGLPTGIDHRIVHAAPDLGGVPAALLPLVTACLAKDPRQRPPAPRLAERTADLHGEHGTLVFPTLVLAGRTAGAGAPEGGTALTREQWEVPAPAEDLTRTLPHVPPTAPSGEPWLRGEEAREVLTGIREDLDRLGREPGGPGGGARSELRAARGRFKAARRELARDGRMDAGALRTAVDAVRAAARTAAAGDRRPPGPGALGPAPARQGHSRGWRALTLTVAALFVGLTVWLGVSDLDDPTAAAPAPRPTGTAAPAAAVRTARPSQRPSAAGSAPSRPASRTVFGGLGLTPPAGWTMRAVPHDGLRTDDTLAGRYGLDVYPKASAPTASGTADDDSDDPPAPAGGVAVEWVPSLDTLDGGTGAFDAFGSRFDHGAAEPSDDADDGPGRTVTRVDGTAALSVAGQAARTWRLTTDVRPDYRHVRTAPRQVWLLPRSHYVLYTFGTLTAGERAAVPGLIASLRFGPAAMPLDCADAVRAADAEAAAPPGGRPGTADAGTPSDLAESCYALALDEGDDTDARDPGTVRTATEPECLALAGRAEALLSATAPPGSYARARSRCDLPRRG